MKQAHKVVFYWVCGFVGALGLSSGLLYSYHYRVHFFVTTYLTMAVASAVYGTRTVVRAVERWRNDSPDPDAGSRQDSARSPAFVEEEVEVDNDDDKDQVLTGQSPSNDIESQVPIDRKQHSPQPQQQLSRTGRTTTTTTTNTTTRQRLYFLDGTKVFLTALVVTHHCLCAFGGCGGPGSWFLIVGQYAGAWQTVASSVTMLDQAYFMPLFFFVSAYFTPASYDRKGQNAFLTDKSKRLWIPAMVASFTVVPFSGMIAQAAADAVPTYLPTPGQCWFLFWLLLFDWAFSTIRQARTAATTTTPTTTAADADATSINATVVDEPHGNCRTTFPQCDPNCGTGTGNRNRRDIDSCPNTAEDPEELTATDEHLDESSGDVEQRASSRPALPEPPPPQPPRSFRSYSVWFRWAFGAVVCGLLGLGFYYAAGGTVGAEFYTMPVTIGSFVSDLSFFAIGVVASDQKWFQQSEEQDEEEGNPPYLLLRSIPSLVTAHVAALLEGGLSVVCLYFLEQNLFLWGTLLWLATGMFCVDMSLVVLNFFQRSCSSRFGKFGTFLTRAAYTVYVIHPLVVTAVTASFVRAYNAAYGEGTIQFEAGWTVSDSELRGPGHGSLHLFVGWLVVLVVSQLLVWPLAYSVRSLPGFNAVL